MVTGPLLIVIFIVSLAFLLVTIIKFKLNAFVSLIITSFLTALLVRMPFGDITSAVADGFSGTIGGIGIVTGMGVMLGMLLFESGGINAIADKMIHLFGEKNSPAGLGIAAYLRGYLYLGMWSRFCFPLWSELCPGRQISAVCHLSPAMRLQLP